MTDYQAAVDAVVRKTYQEHALGDRPWGIGGRQGCSYLAGCAIGVSVSREVAFQMDNGDINNLFYLLRDYEPLQLELFGVVGSPPQAVADQLVRLQGLHDGMATTRHHRETPSAARGCRELLRPAQGRRGTHQHTL